MYQVNGLVVLYSSLHFVDATCRVATGTYSRRKSLSLVTKTKVARYVQFHKGKIIIIHVG